MKLQETTFFQNLSVSFREKGADVNMVDAEIMFKSVVEFASDFLRQVRGNKGASALKFIDNNGTLRIAAVLDYNKNPEEGQDNYNYYWTFDEEDIKDAKQYDISQTNVQAVYNTTLGDRHNCTPIAGFVYTMLISPFDVLIDFLRDNAKEGEEFEVELDGYFKASSTVENGEVVMAFVPSGQMKTLIKDDSTVEA